MAFLDLDLETSVAQLETDAQDSLVARFPDLEFPDGALLTWLIKALVGLGADLGDLAVNAGEQIFDQFGEQVLGLAPIAASSATGATTWTAPDTAGHTIPAGTQVAIAISGDENVAFEVLTEVVIPPGSAATSAGGVTISAVEEGEAANGLTANPTLIDALDVDYTIVLTGATAGGVDAEDPAVYLDRLAAEFRLLTPRPILPADAETLARRIAGVQRALALDGYNPDDDTTGNERFLTVAVVDENGADPGAPIRTAVDTLLQSEREINFEMRVIPPTLTAVKVTVTATAREGFDTADVEADVIAAVTDYLDPAKWGGEIGGDPPTTWRNIDKVYRNELIAVADRVNGVDLVTNVQLALQAGVLGTADVTLDTPAPLPTAGTILATVT